MSLFDDPRVASINPDADYDADISHDGGLTWEVSSRGTNCGEMVQIEMVREIRGGRDFDQEGPIVTITGHGATLTRWTPRS